MLIVAFNGNLFLNSCSNVDHGKNRLCLILASGRYGTLYIGVTSDLLRRVWQHRAALAPGFTSRYAVKKLVWYEQHGDIVTAITREKQLKKWRRDWKIEMIQRTNPLWHDLYGDIVA